MPNDEHVAMLGRGAAVWNDWRAKPTRRRTYLAPVCEGSTSAGSISPGPIFGAPTSEEQNSATRISPVPIWSEPL